MIDELFNVFLGISKAGFLFGLINIIGYYAYEVLKLWI